MHVRSSDLGGGFVAYGIYPNIKNFVLCVKIQIESFLAKHIKSIGNTIPTKPVSNIKDQLSI